MSSHAATAERESRTAEVRRASRPSAPARLGALGGEPRVSLLPPEVNDYHRAKAVRRRLVGGIVAVLLAVLLAVAGSIALSFAAQAGLEAARLQSQDLLAQQAEYSDLRDLQSGIRLIEAGQTVGASTEIEWKAYLEDLQATLPPGVTLDTVDIDSASPFVDYTQSSVPLQGARVATLSFAAISPTIPSIPVWLDGLADLTGFVDAVPGSVAIQPDGTYQVNMTMHINQEAYSLRFAEETE